MNNYNFLYLKEKMNFYNLLICKKTIYIKLILLCVFNKIKYFFILKYNFINIIFYNLIKKILSKYNIFS